MCGRAVVRTCGFAVVVLGVGGFVRLVRPRPAFNLCKSFVRSFVRRIASRVLDFRLGPPEVELSVHLRFVLASLSIQWTQSIVRHSN